jgi:hypothetical protein
MMGLGLEVASESLTHRSNSDESNTRHNNKNQIIGKVIIFAVVEKGFGKPGFTKIRRQLSQANNVGWSCTKVSTLMLSCRLVLSSTTVL